MQRLQSGSAEESKIKQASMLKHESFRLFKRMGTKTYSMSIATMLKDLAVSSSVLKTNNGLANHQDIYHEIKQLSQQIKETPGNQQDSILTEALEKINGKYQASLNFFYPVMKPVESAHSNLIKTHVILEKIKNKMNRAMVDIQLKLDKTISNVRKKMITSEKQRLKDKYDKEIAMVENEITNRTKMLAILKQFSFPNKLKDFMNEVNNLSTTDKLAFASLLTIKERLSSRRELVTEPYELMFAYNAACEDLIVGVRSRYDHDHPHPSILGGEEPEVLVAGTIDIQLDRERFKISKMRIDSGHFKPGPESLELLMRYVSYEINPDYYDQVILHTVDGDNLTPNTVIRRT